MWTGRVPAAPPPFDVGGLAEEASGRRGRFCRDLNEEEEEREEEEGEEEDEEDEEAAVEAAPTGSSWAGFLSHPEEGGRQRPPVRRSWVWCSGASREGQ